MAHQYMPKIFHGPHKNPPPPPPTYLMYGPLKQRIMIASSAALFHIYIGLYFRFLFHQIRGRKNIKKIEEKKEEEYDQMWINFKTIYNTLESQTIFVRGLRPKASPAGTAYSTHQTSQLNLTHFVWVRLARFVSTDPRIIFLYYPLD